MLTKIGSILSQTRSKCNDALCEFISSCDHEGASFSLPTSRLRTYAEICELMPGGPLWVDELSAW